MFFTIYFPEKAIDKQMATDKEQDEIVARETERGIQRTSYPVRPLSVL